MRKIPTEGHSTVLFKTVKVTQNKESPRNTAKKSLRRHDNKMEGDTLNGILEEKKDVRLKLRKSEETMVIVTNNTSTSVH